MISVLRWSLRSEEEDQVPLDLLPAHIQSVKSIPGAMLEVILPTSDTSRSFTEKTLCDVLHQRPFSPHITYNKATGRQCSVQRYQSLT